MASIQQRLSKVRAPRVHITYEVETGNAILIKELPFNMGVIADLHGDTVPTKQYKDRQFISIDADNVMSVMSTINPSVQVEFNLNLSAIGGEDNKHSINMNFTHIDNFGPDHIIGTVPPLNELYRRIENLRELKLRIQNNESFMRAALNALEKQDIKSSLKDNNIIETPEVTAMFEEFLSCNFKECNEDNIISNVAQTIMKMESTLGNALNEILHTPKFQTLEGTWRGIIYIVQRVSLGTSICLKVFDCDIQELIKDLSNALEFDQSYLFRKVYEEGYGTYGGYPFNILALDHYVGADAQSIGLLNKLSQVMAASHCMAVTGVSPAMFDLENITQLYKIRDISQLFASKAFAQMRGFRETEDSRYVGLIMPRFMVRLPYDPINNPISKVPSYKEVIMKDEMTNVNDHTKYCWSNSVYAYLECIARSFEQYGWFGSIIGPENGGAIDQLNVSLYRNEDSETLIKCPTETAITDRREKELSDNGIVALCYCKDSSRAAFFSAISCNKPIKYNTPEATSNARLSSCMQYMLNVSRFAHYLKVMVRDKIGSFSTVESLQVYLNTWISDYVLLSESDDPAINARYPLAAANITVTADPFKPGRYNAVILMQPRLQMEEITFSLRLVAKLEM